jgi:hypothetical protein
MPVSDQTPEEVAEVRQAIQTPRAAGIAGIVFAVLFVLALVLGWISVPPSSGYSSAVASARSHKNLVLLALGLIPFAGIAFLWFIGVVRARIGEAEDRFFASVFLGSGLLFIGMIFVWAAIATGLVETVSGSGGNLITPGMWLFGRRTAYTLQSIYAMRMAAVFMISTSTILFRARLVPRWLPWSGYTIAAALILVIGFFNFIELLFPVWVFALSTYVLLVQAPAAETRVAAAAT